MSLVIQSQNSKLHPSVYLPTGGRGVVGHWSPFAIPAVDQALGVDTAQEEVVVASFGAIGRKPEIAVFVANVVRMAADF